MDWTRGHTIGHGASATVSKAASRPSGDVFAVKSAELPRSAPLRREHEILSGLDCSNIIGYRGCDITLESGREMFNLFMDYAPDGTLRDVIRRKGGRLDEATISFYANGIVKGLEYLHSRGVVHCDIKGSNVLVSEGEAKIADFGCAKGVKEAAIGGTPMFMAPEAARGEEQGFAADIWALGCTIIEMATGSTPWPNEAATLHRIAFSGEAPEFPALLSDVGKDFLGRCLRVDPRERWSAKELLKHRFFDEFRHEKRITDSPTSILDQGIWSSVEEEYSDDLSEVNLGEMLDSPVKRVKELLTDSAVENWDWREKWITVRESNCVDIRIDCNGRL